MIISKTPYRISLFGGGTDYSEFYLRSGGSVISTTIDHYCYLSCRVLPSFFEAKHRVVWSHIETVNSISEILHPAVREGLRYMGFDDSVGLEIHHQGDLPARAGIGSSSAFSVGLIHALSALRGERIVKHELALRAIELEQKVLGETGGSQDQVASAYGGFNRIEFKRSGEIRVSPLILAPDRLEELHARLLLVYTGSSRLSSEISAGLVANMGSHDAELQKILGTVDDALSILNGSGGLDDLGHLLHEAWLRKRELSPDISNSRVDAIYERARSSGALGGKLLGAGGSGFMVFFVPEGRQPDVEAALEAHVRVPFRFESEGSRLVYDGTES